MGKLFFNIKTNNFTIIIFDISFWIDSSSDFLLSAFLVLDSFLSMKRLLGREELSNIKNNRQLRLLKKDFLQTTVILIIYYQFIHQYILENQISVAAGDLVKILDSFNTSGFFLVVPFKVVALNHEKVFFHNLSSLPIYL